MKYNIQFLIVLLLMVQNPNLLVESQGATCRVNSDCSTLANQNICCSKYGYCGPGDNFCNSGCLIPDVEFVGGDLPSNQGGGGIPAGDDDLCSIECEKRPTCRWYTYDMIDKTCFLKSSRGYDRDATKKKTIISGSIKNDGCEPEPECEPPYTLVNLQCMYSPPPPQPTQSPPTTISPPQPPTVSPKLPTPATSPPFRTPVQVQPSINDLFSNLSSALEGLSGASSLCDSVDGFVPFNLLRRQQLNGRMLQGQRTPDVFNSSLGFGIPQTFDETFDLNNFIEDDDNSKIGRLTLSNSGGSTSSDNFIWLNFPPRKGFCVATDIALPIYRWVPCQQNLKIVCERNRLYPLPSFPLPRTFENDPFSQPKEVTITKMESLPPTPNVEERPIIVIEARKERPVVTRRFFTLADPPRPNLINIFRLNGVQNPYINHHSRIFSLLGRG